MGAFGCKYCNCDKEKMEDVTEEMKIQSNPPILVTNENKDKNNENKEKFGSNNEELSIKIEINNLEKNEKQSLLKNTTNYESYPKNNEDNINNYLKSNNNEQILSNNLISNTSNYINNIQDLNNEVFIIEENNLSKNNINNKNNKNNMKEIEVNSFAITNTRDAKKKIKEYEISKIQFGLGEEDKDNLSKEQIQIYNEAQNNLKQFNAPQKNDISHLQDIMTNILFKLKDKFLKLDLNANTDDMIVLSDLLKKLVNYEINAHNTTMYSERFCVLYPQYLKYYKSKEQFLRNLKPGCVLPIAQISAVNIAKPKKSNKKLYHLIICNKLAFKKTINNSVFLNLFDSCEINDYLTSPDLNESLLIFTSDDEKNIFKWYVVIQYLIEFKKRNN